MEKIPERPNRVLEGIKVLELCRIIAGPTVTRILAEYGANVLKITSPNLSDVRSSRLMETWESMLPSSI